MNCVKVKCWLYHALILSGLLLCLQVTLSSARGSRTAQAQATIPFAIGTLPVAELCHYNLVLYERDDLLLSDGSFNPTVLDVARLCDTQVIVRLHGLTADIADTSGGLDLVQYEDRINDFWGLIDPYIDNGVVIAHLTIDEPHNCNDWHGSCPSQASVDEAAQISRSYWPTLKTIINTLPYFATAYNWVYTDNIQFMYAYHKGPLADFIMAATDVLDNGYVRQISWGLQAKLGGCSEYGQCSMTPQQVSEAGTAMCDTQIGQMLSFSRYDTELIDETMQQMIDYLRAYCGDPMGEPPTPFTVNGLVYADLNSNNVFDSLTETPLSGVAVTLAAAADGTIYTAVTNNRGQYIITGLAADTYTIDAVDSTLPPGHTNVTRGDILVGQSVSVTFDFPLRVNALSGFVYRDNNSNTIYDPPDDTLYSGLVIQLIGSNGEFKTTVTDDAGQYAFRGLPADTYTITIDAHSLDPGWSSIPGFRSRTILDTSNFTDLNFAVQPPTGVINGIAFIDVGGDGSYEPPGDSGQPEAVIHLRHPDGSVTATTTDSNGAYSFTALSNGNYVVTLDASTLPPGHSTNKSWSLTISGHTLIDNANFPIRRNSVSGRVYIDNNRNRNYDPAEDTPLVNGVLNLESAGGAMITTTTDMNGVYLFVGIAPDIYLVTVDADSLMPGFFSRVASQHIKVLIKSQIGGKDFPIWSNGIGGVVFLDQDADKMYDQPGDIPLAGIVVGMEQPDGSIITTTTGPNGLYQFDGLVPGSYTIMLNTGTLPPGTVSPKPEWTVDVIDGTYKVNFNFWIWD